MEIPAPRSRAARLRYERHFAERALEEYGLGGASLRLLKYSSTALFRVDADERYVLRLHPPERMTTDALQSELHWLTTLHHETHLWIPEPVPSHTHQLLVTCHLPNTTDNRRCGLFRWMPGGHKVQRLTPADAYRMGECLGELHAFAASYTFPPTFRRWSLDWGGFVDSVVQEPNPLFALDGEEQNQLALAVDRVRVALEQLRQQPDTFGLIHGDTNLTNFRFDRNRVGLLDFEACSFGYYLFDVTRTLLEFAQIPERAAQLAAAFHSGYTQIRALPELDSPHMIAFRIMNVVDLIVWIMAWDDRMPLQTGRPRIVAAMHDLRQLLGNT